MFSVKIFLFYILFLNIKAMGWEYILGVDATVLSVWLYVREKREEEFEEEMQFSGWVRVLYIEIRKDTQVVRVKK